MNTEKVTPKYRRFNSTADVYRRPTIREMKRVQLPEPMEPTPFTARGGEGT